MPPVERLLAALPIGAVAEESSLSHGLTAIGVDFSALLLVPVAGANSRAKRPFRIAKIENASGEIAAYVATYLLTLLVVGDTRPRDIEAYSPFLAVVGLILIRGNLLHYDPWIFVFGRRIFSVRVGARHYYLIAAAEPKADDDIEAKLFGDRFLLM